MQHLSKFIETKESVCIRKELNSHRAGLGDQHGRRFIVLGHQYGRRDVMWKHSIGPRNWQICTKLQCLLLCAVTSSIYIIITVTFILLLFITSQIVFILVIFIIIVIIIIIIIIIITIIIKINPPFSLELTFKACKVMIKSSASMLARLKLTSSLKGM